MTVPLGRLPVLDRDARLLFATRGLRMFSYGLVSVVLVLYLAALGLRDASIGLLLGLTLAGDAAISLWLTTHADRFGRRRVLLVGRAAHGVRRDRASPRPTSSSCSSWPR